MCTVYIYIDIDMYTMSRNIMVFQWHVQRFCTKHVSMAAFPAAVVWNPLKYLESSKVTLSQ